MAVALGQGETDRLRELAGRVGSSCASCHRSPDGDQGRRPSIEKQFRHHRQKRGIGRGYYVVGHDLTIFDEDPKLAQAVATDVRNAALLTERIIRIR